MVTLSDLSFCGADFRQYEITDGDVSAAVVPEKGGMVVSLKLRGEEYSWLRGGNFEKAERPRCGFPVLFPCCGVADNGVNIFGGKAYPMENHGFADLLPWDVLETGESSLTLGLRASAITKFLYPFDFALKITYSVKGGALHTKFHVANTGSGDMPFSFGFHPYFACSGIENLKFDLKADFCSDNSKERTTPAPAAVDFPYDPNQTTRMFRGVKSPVTICDSENSHRIVISFDEHFKNFILWQQGAEKFVAAEPWNGWANSLNEPGEHEVLAPGASMTAEWSVSPENI